MTPSRASRLPVRIGLAGSVTSSRRTLEALIAHEATVVGVLGLSAELEPRVSGFRRLDDLASVAGAEFVEFRRINDGAATEAVKRWDLDVLFVVGLSQIVKQELLESVTLGVVGFHPTLLPEGRGRAPVAWLTLERRAGAATFFVMEEGMDSGPVLVQEPFAVTERDYASDVESKIERAIDRALERWLPELLSGRWSAAPQDHAEASFRGRRAPEDGLIDWSAPVSAIHDLVRAASHPHPGAYSYLGDRRLVVWRVEPDTASSHRGVPGRVLAHDEARGVLVQAGDAPLWLTDLELRPDGGEDISGALRPGVRLGYAVQDQLAALRERVHALEDRLDRLERDS